ncbi:MAG: CAP domain-containing protein [Alphaproteobacteria bacterium]|nr:CAP domain-containing protein [Alphaproteobacteria bacterium]
MRTRFFAIPYRPLLAVAWLFWVAWPGAALSDLQSRLIAQVNVHRLAQGLGPLARHPALTAAALAHAADMAETHNLSHRGCDGSELGDRLHRAGYGFRRAAENVAAGPETPEQAVDLWMASEGHRRNMLIADLTEAGAAVARHGAMPNPPYWVLVLGRR